MPTNVYEENSLNVNSKDETINILRDLISIDSQCNKSNKEIAKYIKEKLSGFETTEMSFKKENFDLYNLIFKIPGESSENPVVFVGHTDTVPVNSDWKKEPFKLTVEDETLYGLGASDMKGALACVITAALSLDKKPKNDVYLIFDADEEDSLLGGKYLVDNFSLSNARVVIMEPTDGKILYAQKGCLDLIIETKGVAIHSSQTNSENNEKNNAIYKATEVCRILKEYEKEIEMKDDALFGRPSFNIGLISGGTAPNTVPEKCIIRVSRRLIPREDIKEEYEEIRKRILSVFPETKISPTFWGASYYTDKNGKFARELSKLAEKHFGESLFDIQKAWTEAALFSSWGETLIFGPGEMSKAHQPDESVKIRDLRIFTEIYKELMDQ